MNNLLARYNAMPAALRWLIPCGVLAACAFSALFVQSRSSASPATAARASRPTLASLASQPGTREPTAVPPSEAEVRPIDDPSPQLDRVPGDADPGIPSPLTDEEIARMDRGTILKEFPTRRNYARKTPGIDPAVKERLEAEVVKLQDHLKKTRLGGPS